VPFSVLPVENVCRISTGSAKTADSTIMYVSAAQTFAFGILFSHRAGYDYTQKKFCGLIAVQRKLIF